MSKIIDVTAETFQADVIDRPGPVLVDFWRHGCQLCDALLPVFEQMSEDRAGALTVVKAQWEKNLVKGTEISGHYKLRMLPVLALYNNGKLVDARSGTERGVDPAKFLDAWVDVMLEYARSQDAGQAALPPAAPALKPF